MLMYNLGKFMGWTGRDNSLVGGLDEFKTKLMQVKRGDLFGVVN
jgi:hypothetical protein